MTNKNTTVAIGLVVALLIASYFFFPIFYSRSQNVQDSSTPAPQGKLNINTICESALAYMSFPDGASAEVFMKDCKEGKHPEVIENYIKQLDLSGEVAI